MSFSKIEITLEYKGGSSKIVCLDFESLENG